jgi:ABC-type sugar transport system permease subunit
MSKLSFRPDGKFRTPRFGPLPWILPSILLIVIWVFWPAFEMVRTSFREVSRSGVILGYVGFENYSDLIARPELAPIFLRTMLWVLTIVFFTALLSLPLASLLNQKFPGRTVVRWFIILPWAASVFSTALTFRWMLNGYYGFVNTLLIDLRIIDEPIDWLGYPNVAIAWMVAVAVFVSLPFTSFVLLAGLQTIPNEIREAAQVDGSSSWRTYWRIIFPLLRPALLVALVINLINVFNNFPIIWVMTQGGPGNSTDVTTTFMYKLAFRMQEMGQSAALATFNFVIIFLFILLFLRVSGWRQQNEN